MSGQIAHVDPGSLAEELGWLPGDEIVSINGHVLSDAIDFRFYSSDEYLRVLVRRGALTTEFEIEKDADVPLGVTFTDILFDGVRTCGAHCLFCFVNQLPKGLRKSLYLKDDDFRLSFLQGNFVTLANVSSADLGRIVTQRLSPLYLSVHATDSDLRERMLGRRAPSILHQIDALARGRIELHTQVVLCRGINDGAVLRSTVQELAARYPAVASIAIVPAGLTSHRRHAVPIPAMDAEYCANLLRDIQRWQRDFLSDKGTRLVWAADEFYFNSGRRIPRAETYEGFPQIENGVGLVRRFIDDGYRAASLLRSWFGSSSNTAAGRTFNVAVATGELAAPVLEKWAAGVECDRLRISIYPVPNTLFGRTVTVAGLMAGRDVIETLQCAKGCDMVVIPSVALRDDAFVDDVTLSQVHEAIQCPVYTVSPRPTALARLIAPHLLTGSVEKHTI